MGRERILSGRMRRAQRARNWDYRSTGLYFITIVTWDREPLFGAIQEGVMLPNSLGLIVAGEWQRTSEVRPLVRLDEFVVMPNHFHGIVEIVSEMPRGSRGGLLPARNELEEPANGLNHSLSSIVRGFKAKATGRINAERGTFGEAVWHRSLHDSIIRDVRHLQAVRSYIRDNPKNWPSDPHNAGSPPTG